VKENKCYVVTRSSLMHIGCCMCDDNDECKFYVKDVKSENSSSDCIWHRQDDIRRFELSCFCHEAKLDYLAAKKIEEL